MGDIDWDGWLARLTEYETVRDVTDVRAHLITEISRAMSNTTALGASDPHRLAEIAVDSLIDCARRMRLRPS